MNFNNEKVAIAALKKLRRRIRIAGKLGLKARIEFVQIVFMNRLKDKVVRLELFDEHNIGERDFDTCFEMFDGDYVIHGVVTAAKQDDILKECLILQLGQTQWEYWNETYNSIEHASGQLALI